MIRKKGAVTQSNDLRYQALAQRSKGPKAIGTNVEGKMAAALRRLGFDGVYDTDFAADMTIMEEATEFMERLKTGENLPIITSCCPGWVKYCEEFYPEFLPNVSTCKSPQQMFGALAKTYYAEKNGLDPKDIVCVSVMPCTAKKFEHKRNDECAAGEGIPDVDIALTTRALGNMIKRAGLLFENMPDEEFDPALGIASGAAHLFGVTGGVMEAALRTAAETLTGKELADEALKSGKLGGYATDVMADELTTGGLTEGVGFDSPLFECDNFIASPHLGAQTADAARNIGVHIINKVKTSLNLE